jgi:hypothetical protein
MDGFGADRLATAVAAIATAAGRCASSPGSSRRSPLVAHSTAAGCPVRRMAFNGTPAAGVHERRMRRVLEAIYRDLGLAAELPPG